MSVDMRAMSNMLRAHYPESLSLQDIAGVPAFNDNQLIQMRICIRKPRRTVRRNRKEWARYQNELAEYRAHLRAVARIAAIRVPKLFFEKLEDRA
jgi:hypothetical protein